MSIDLIQQIPPSPDWMAYGECLGLDPDLFHPEVGQDTRRAKKVCAECPVKAECLDHALRNGEVIGVWGGTSEKERRRLRQAWARERGIDLVAEARRRPIEHGTVSGYKRCTKRPEGACPRCQESMSRHAEYNRPSRAKVPA